MARSEVTLRALSSQNLAGKPIARGEVFSCSAEVARQRLRDGRAEVLAAEDVAPGRKGRAKPATAAAADEAAPIIEGEA